LLPALLALNLERSATQRISQLAAVAPDCENHYMSVSHCQLFESALSLPQSERADLAFQLLQTLTPPGQEVTADEFGAELYGRLEAHRRGELESFTLDETRDIIRQRVSQRRPS
jgi:putative addiction module component (TIGR02574 family)